MPEEDIEPIIVMCVRCKAGYLTSYDSWIKMENSCPKCNQWEAWYPKPKT